MTPSQTFNTEQQRSAHAWPLMMAAVALTMAACSAPPAQQAAPAGSPAESSAPAQPATPPAAQELAGSPSTAAAPAPATATSPGASAPAPAPVSAAAPAQAGSAAPTAAAPPAPAAPPPPPAPRVAELKAGQPITIRTTHVLSTKTSKTGTAFSAILEEPISVDGWVVAAAGARVEGRVVESDPGGRIKGKASLSIELTSLTVSGGRKVEIVTSPVSSEAAANKGKDVAKVGIGAGAGAAVGAIAGGGKGAAVGALVGGGAGAAMRGDAAEIPAESVVSFELRSPITIREKK